MKRWALIDNESNIVKNVILWDGISEWNPPDNLYVIGCDDFETAQPGAIYENGVFWKPIPVEETSNNEVTILTANNEVTSEPTVI